MHKAQNRSYIDETDNPKAEPCQHAEALPCPNNWIQLYAKLHYILARRAEHPSEGECWGASAHIWQSAAQPLTHSQLVVYISVFGQGQYHYPLAHPFLRRSSVPTRIFPRTILLQGVHFRWLQSGGMKGAIWLATIVVLLGMHVGDGAVWHGLVWEQ
jgi:hypothetical protein